MSAPRLVLVRPRNIDNLLAIARVLAGFGVGDWVVVSSAAHLEGMYEVARRYRAPGELELLTSLRRVDTVAAAVAGCRAVVGTTMRALPGRPRLSVEELAGHTARPHATPWALVFGAESNGLQDDDLRHCDTLSYVPSEEAQPSLNLSQAVVVYGYALTRARGVTTSLVDVTVLRELRDIIADGLRARGIPRRAADEVLAPLVRAGLTEGEAAVQRALWQAKTVEAPTR